MKVGLIPPLAVVFIWLSSLQPVSAQTGCQTSFAESFDGGSNIGGWLWGSPSDTIPSSGGNPGAFLRSAILDTFAPQGRTTLGMSSVYTGDYRARGVSSVGVDLTTISVQFMTCVRPLSLVLINDSGTPGDLTDDCQVYFVTSQQCPCPGDGWISYDVAVPSGSTVLPSGWGALGPCDTNPDQAWNQVIQDVDRVLWFFGDPTFFFIFAQWEVGLDNPRITYDEVPVAYCTGKTNSLGCVPFMSFAGSPSASDTSPFNISGNDHLPAEFGILIYGFAKSNLNFHGGKLCVKSPFTRMTAKAPKAAANCKGGAGGTLTRNFNAAIQSGSDPLLTAGASVFAQWRQRDPSDPTGFGDNLTNGLQFTICN